MSGPTTSPISGGEPLGLLADESPYVYPDAELVEILEAGKAECVAYIEANMAPSESVNGWRSVPTSFNYNLDNLGIGTLDTPEWKFPDRANAYFFRAIVARVGLWGQRGYEAVYPQIFVDDQGAQLNGARQYVMHIEELPPVDAFWSITMYNMPKYYLVENPIDRYSIGDRTPGLKNNDDGSLDIYIQRDSPGPDKESNWLPAPEGDFRPVLRMYPPRPEALDGTWQPPLVETCGLTRIGLILFADNDELTKKKRSINEEANTLNQLNQLIIVSKQRRVS